MQPRRFFYLRTQVIEPTHARPLLVKDPGEYGAGSISVRQEEGGERRRYFDHAPRTRFRRCRRNDNFVLPHVYPIELLDFGPPHPRKGGDCVQRFRFGARYFE
jgi:hypothetical protein